MSDPVFRHFFNKALAAKTGGHAVWRRQTIDEKLAVALVLNRADWLSEMNFSIVEAIEQVGPLWLSLMPRVVRSLESEA